MDVPADEAEGPRDKPGIPKPFTLVIFGASGDLTRRKLIPAVYRLFSEGLLPDDFRIVGFARREKTDDSFRAELRQAVEQYSRLEPHLDENWGPFARRIFYHRSTFEDAAGFQSLFERLKSLAGPEGPGNCLFYLAAQPNSVPVIVEQLGGAGLSCEGENCWSRIIVEKPFGRDLESARALNAQIGRAFDEHQIFRIDHYLGKETVQNILVLRFANSIFEPIWNQQYVDHVQITVSETIGLEGRGRYYEQAGALRDMVQNHMMHLLCLTAMEPPVGLDADAIRDEKVKVLEALRPIPVECLPSDLVRAHYTSGDCGGETVPGYRDEDGVDPDSTTETFVAFKALVDNRRWSGVPFYLRTGKRLPARLTDIAIHFKVGPRVLFNGRSGGPMEPNVLAIRIQPNEGISLQFQVKTPGSITSIRPLRMDFSYADAFGQGPPEAYERLLLDAALGDSTLFTRRDEVERAWAFVTPILAHCADRPLATYAAGSWGPAEADDLIAADGRRWEVMKRPLPRDRTK